MNFYISGNRNDLKELIKILKKAKKEMKVISKSNDHHEIEVSIKSSNIGELNIDGTEVKFDKEFKVK